MLVSRPPGALGTVFIPCRLADGQSLPEMKLPGVSNAAMHALAQQTIDPAVQLPIAGLAAAVLLATAWAGRRRLPPSVSEALFVVGLSGLPAVAYVAMFDPANWLLPLCTAATGLAVLWYIGSGRVAATVCGLLATGLAIGLPDTAPAGERLAATVCLAALLMLAAHHVVLAGAELSRYAVVALLGCALHLWFPTGWFRSHGGTCAAVFTCLAAGVLLVSRIPIWQHWRYRRRVWRTNPQRLIDPPAESAVLTRVVLLGCALIGIGGLLAPDGALSPLAAALAALAAFTVANRQGGRNLPGEIGLILLGEAVILAARSWLPDAGVNTLLGCALAAAYLLWLARFWHQQLHEGVAWTTAGRLVEPSRQLGHAGALGCLALAVTTATSGPPADDTVWPVGLAALLLLLLGSVLVREAKTHLNVSAALAACGVVLATAVPAWRLLEELGVSVTWPPLLAAAGLLLAARVGPSQGKPGADAAFDACIAGILPGALLYAVSIRGAYGEGWFGPAAATVLAVLAIALRWRPRRKTEAPPA